MSVRVESKVRVRVSIRTRETSTTVELDLPPYSRPEGLVDVLRTIDDAVVAQSRQAAVREGRHVTCREGCGACCRQLVPLTTAEARAMVAALGSLPHHRQQVLKSRFESAMSALEEAGLVEAVWSAMSGAPGSTRRLGLSYFELGIPCPFLEEEKCSIYEARPMACREYLVTSPAEECLTLKGVERVPVPGRLLPQLRRGAPGEVTTVPLVAAPRWVSANPEPPSGHIPRPTSELLADMLRAPKRPQNFTRKSSPTREEAGV